MHELRYRAWIRLIGLAGGGVLLAEGCTYAGVQANETAASVVSGLLISFINGWVAQAINSLLGVPATTGGF
ncbi:MAG TPA: hypothetical protein VMZ31_14555 [Phycisphaerae bacterium]|nr:hypothetical protein [Phycisphaerae bacterium]